MISWDYCLHYTAVLHDTVSLSVDIEVNIMNFLSIRDTNEFETPYCDCLI